ncbi:MAG: TIGR04086 family membrane protein, partial [Syntrophomonadaceae bacterium]|nr:TIGR04086 family membrane protein [Syntrophomonadaceae bacterium]
RAGREFKNREVTEPPQRYYPGRRFKSLHLPAVDWLAVVWGWVASMAITLVVLAAAAFYVALTPGSVFYLSTYLFLNKVVSPLLGGVLAGMRAKTAAALVGLWVGLGYGFIVLVFRLYGGLFDYFWTEALTSLLASLFAGVVGSILGATLAASRTAREKRRGVEVG